MHHSPPLPLPFPRSRTASPWHDCSAQSPARSHQENPLLLPEAPCTGTRLQAGSEVHPQHHVFPQSRTPGATTLRHQRPLSIHRRGTGARRGPNRSCQQGPESRSSPRQHRQSRHRLPLGVQVEMRACAIAPSRILKGLAEALSARIHRRGKTKSPSVAPGWLYRLPLEGPGAWNRGSEPAEPCFHSRDRRQQRP